MWRWWVMAAVICGAVLVAAGCGGAGGGSASIIVGPEGRVFQVGGIIVDVLPGAVLSPVEVLVAPLSAAQLPLLPPGGLAVMSAGRFEVNLAEFELPVTITFPLAARLPAGKSPLWQVQGNTWEHSVWNAVVAPDGRTATASVRNFTTYAIFADYAPLSVGASWTYQRSVQTPPNPAQVSTITATIAGIQPVDGLETLVWSESDPSAKTLYLHRSDTELLLAGVQESGQSLQVLTPPARLLMLPPAAGQTWQVSSLFDTTAQAAVTAETIAVGGAEYDAMKVHIAASSGDYLDLWFAPQVGPVKWKQAVVEPGVGTTVTELDLLP